MEQKGMSYENDELLVKYLTGMANASEREEALAWIHHDDQNSKYFDQIRDIYESSKLTQLNHTYDSGLSWEKVKSKYYKKRAVRLENENEEDKRYFIREVMKYAAVIIAVLTIGVVSFKFLNKSPVDVLVWNEVEAPFGSRSMITLADGSRVWLNAGSKLKYAVNFGQKSREVFLTGEAYFNVAKYKEMQFVVKTSHLNVKVLGTEFNVKAYPEENTIQTTLVRGLVTIERSGANKAGNLPKEIYLKPNQTITFIKDLEIYDNTVKVDKRKREEKVVRENNNLILLPKIDPVVFTSWKDNRWFIQGETLSSLAVKLERRYNVKFRFNTGTLENYKFTGTLKDETLEQVLNLIKLSSPITYSIKENTVYLNENNSFKKSYDEMLINRETK